MRSRLQGRLVRRDKPNVVATTTGGLDTLASRSRNRTANSGSSASPARSTSATTYNCSGPTNSNRSSVTRSTSGRSNNACRVARRTRGSASCPTKNHRFRLINSTATTPSSTPIRIDPTASGTSDPVS